MAESPTPIAEIDHGPSKFDQFLDQHTTKLIIGAILIALGAVGFVIYSGLAEAKAEEAGSALTAAESISDYQDVIGQWPESKSAESATLLLAGAQAEESPEDAIQTLRDFIDKYPEHSAVATAKVSLGLKLAEQGSSDEAVTLLTEVADDASASYISPLASISLGDIAKSAGNSEEAKSWYEKALEDVSDQGNTYADTAQARLLLVNAAPPTKVKPAPPAPIIPKAPSPIAPTAPTPNVPKPNLEIPDSPEKLLLPNGNGPQKNGANTPKTPTETDLR